MRSSRQGAIPSELGWLVDELDDVADRLKILEAPSGEALSSTVAKLQSLVANMQAQLDAWAAGRWDNATILAQINARILAVLGGSVTIGGAFYAPDAVAFNITAARRTAWLEDATGRLGYAPSSIKTKTSIRPSGIDPLVVLGIEEKSFIYRAEIARRTRLRINEGIDYTPRRELGLMAQDLVAAGLSDFVIFGPDGEPEGIEYAMLPVALFPVLRYLRDENAELRARVEVIEGIVG